MTAHQQTKSSRLKPLWRVRRPVLSVMVTALFAAAMLWSSLLVPRTFQATGSWVGNPDSRLTQIDHPPLLKIAEDVLKQSHLETPHITVMTIANASSRLLVTARANSARLAIDRVDEWLAQRAAHLTEQLATQLNRLTEQHQLQITMLITQRTQLTEQITAAQSLMTDSKLPTHEALAIELSNAQQKLDELNRQQAVYLGANRTLKGLLSRKQLLEQDLAMHQQRYGRDDDDPAVKLVKDQLAKLNVRIEVISEASKHDVDANAKLAKVSVEIDTIKQVIAAMRGKQQQLVEQAQAAQMLAKLVPQRQALDRQLGYHRHQLSLANDVLGGQVAWGHIQQATVEQTHVIWPSLKHILLFVSLAALLFWALMQWCLRLLDRTFDYGMPIEQSLDMAILGLVTFERRVSWLSRLCRLTVYPLVSAAVLVVLSLSLTVVYLNLHQPRESASLLQLLASPQHLMQIWYTTPQRHLLPPRALPVVIQVPDRSVKQLSDRSSAKRI